MIVSHIDPESRSTIAAADGFHALGRGDTVLAREKFTEAGKILEDGAARTESAPEKNLLRFLAASQYYHGGDYQRANRIVQRTKPKYLSKHDQEKFEAFRKDVEARAEKGYPLQIWNTVCRCRTEGRVEDAIRLLQDHPYALDRSDLAWTRADLCLRSGRIKAAVRFSGDAVKYSAFHPKIIFRRAGASIFLKALKKPAEAAEFLQLVQDKEPTALDLAAVSYDLFEKIKQGDSNAGPELLRLMDRAQHDFAQLPPTTTADPDIRFCMSHGYLLAAITADLLSGRQNAMKYVEAGEALAPLGVASYIFRRLRTAADGVWMHDPEIAAQLASILTEQASRHQKVEESAIPEVSTAA